MTEKDIAEGEKLYRIKLNDKYGCIDKTGKVIVKFHFDQVEDFYEGLARVYVGNRYGYINKTGKYVWEPTR